MITLRRKLGRQRGWLYQVMPDHCPDNLPMPRYMPPEEHSLVIQALIITHFLLGSPNGDEVRIEEKELTRYFELARNHELENTQGYEDWGTF